MPLWLNRLEASFFKKMKLFPDLESKKRFMKTALPVILAIAWAPIIWMVVIATLGQGVFALTGSWLIAQAVAIVVVLAISPLISMVFVRLGAKFYSKGEELP